MLPPYVALRSQMAALRRQRSTTPRSEADPVISKLRSGYNYDSISIRRAFDGRWTRVQLFIKRH